MQLDKENIKKIVGIISFAILLNWGLKNTEMLGRLLKLGIGLLLPFLVGGLLAFIINVPMRFLERKLFDEPYQKKYAGKCFAGKKTSLPVAKQPETPTAKQQLPVWYRAKRPLSLILSLLMVVGIIFVGAFLIVPELANSINMVANSAKSFPTQLHKWSQQLMEWMPQAAQWLEEMTTSMDIDWRKTITDIAGFLQNGAGNVLNTTFNVAASIFSGIVTGFLAIVFSFYLLMNKEKLGSQVKQILYACMRESHADYLIRVGAMANRTFSKFLSGQCIEAVILGALFFVSMTILRFPYALMISVLIAFTALIPVFGAFIGCVVGAFLILLVDPLRALWFIVLFLCLQQLEGNLIYPRVVGSSVGLPAIWVLVAVTLGGSMMGVLGMLIYIPLFSVLYSLIREAVQKRLNTKNISSEKYLAKAKK